VGRRVVLRELRLKVPTNRDTDSKDCDSKWVGHRLRHWGPLTRKWACKATRWTYWWREEEAPSEKVRDRRIAAEWPPVWPEVTWNDGGSTSTTSVVAVDQLAFLHMAWSGATRMKR